MTQFALVGCGRIAERHLTLINRTGKRVAVCDLNYSKAALFAKQKGTERIGGQYLNTLYWAPAADEDAACEDKHATNKDGIYTGAMSNHHIVYDELQKAPQGLPRQLPQVQDTVRTVEPIEKLYAAARA